MWVIALKRLREFWEKPGYEDAKEPIRAWYAEATRATWSTPIAIKAQYRTASILKNQRVVFNIRGNKYRLVVKVIYEKGRVYIRFIGTHEEYDRIDATTI